MDKLPYAVQTDLRYQNDIVLCSRTMAEKLTQKMQYRQGGLITYFKTTDHMAVYEQMRKFSKIMVSISAIVWSMRQWNTNPTEVLFMW